MSDSAYDIFLDKCVDEFYEDNEEDLETQEWDGPCPEDFYSDDYDGWDDTQ